MTTSLGQDRWGIYGFQIDGFAEPARLLVPAEVGWPELVVERAVAVEGGRRRPSDRVVGEARCNDHEADIWLGETSSLRVERASMRVRFETEEPLTDDLVAHPYLAFPAAVASHWIGRQVLHGGSFLQQGRAWGVLGAKESGKSSTLGWLSSHGHPVCSDDLLVVDGILLFAGPQCIDLRHATASRLGGRLVDVAGGRERWRLEPPRAPSSAPLAGLVYLAWGDEVRVEVVEPVDRLLHLIQNSVLGPDLVDASAYLELASLPTLRLVRPRRLDVLDEVGAQLLGAIG